MLYHHISRWKLQLSRLNCRFASFGQTHNKIAKHGDIRIPNHDPEPLLLCYHLVMLILARPRLGQGHPAIQFPNLVPILRIPVGPFEPGGMACQNFHPGHPWATFFGWVLLLNIHWGLKTSASGIMKPSQVRRKVVSSHQSPKSRVGFPAATGFATMAVSPKSQAELKKFHLIQPFLIHLTSFNRLNHLFSGQGWPMLTRSSPAQVTPCFAPAAPARWEDIGTRTAPVFAWHFSAPSARAAIQSSAKCPAGRLDQGLHGPNPFPLRCLTPP